MSLTEHQIRRIVNEDLLIEREEALVSDVGEYIETRHYDDVMDDVFKRIAPNMVRHVLEREINEDMAEFLDGAIEGRWENQRGWAGEDPSPKEHGHSADSADYILGYTWGWKNADTWKGNQLPNQARKEAIEAQIQEFEDQVSEQMVIAALEAANEKVNPVKLLKKAGSAISSAVREEGWAGGLKKGLPIAVGIIVGEALDNFIIPMAFFSLTGIPIPPLPVGVGEIINPVVISIVGADIETEELADELGWYEDEYGDSQTLGPRKTTELREYIRALIIEKQQRGQKDKRTLYHINRNRPARPQSKTKYLQEWDPDVIDNEGDRGDYVNIPDTDNWQRWWLDSPVKSGVFLTPNPIDIAINHGRAGDVYAYKVPEWVIAKSGGMHRYDTGSEVLIPEEVWNEAGVSPEQKDGEIEFLGKSMTDRQLWDKIDSSPLGAPRSRRGAPKIPSWLSDEEREAWVTKKKEFNLQGLRVTKHPEDVVKLLKPAEVRAALAAFEKEYPEALTGKKHEPEWQKQPRERQGTTWHIGEKPMSKKDEELIGLLRKRMNESLVRKYIRQLLIESIDGPKVIFMAGGPGSGKSTVIRNIGLGERLEVINPDDQYEESLRAEGIPLDRATILDEYKPIKEEYLAAQEAGDTATVAELEPEYLRLRGILSRNMTLFNQARSASKATQQERIEAGGEFLVDGTGGNYNEIARQVEKLRSVGYDVGMIFIGVPMETSVERDQARGEHGGRYLGRRTVEKSWSSVDKNRPKYENLFGENFFYVDASGDREEFAASIDDIASGVLGFLG